MSAARLVLLLLRRSRCKRVKENRAVSEPEKRPEKISRKNIKAALKNKSTSNVLRFPFS
jgi:hypothetical protein